MIRYKFYGTYEELQDIVKESNVDGKWEDFSSNHKCFRSHGNGLMHWWLSTGTLSFNNGNMKADSKILEIEVTYLLEQSPNFEDSEQEED